MIKKGPHSEIPERNEIPAEPDTIFTNYGNRSTLDIDAVLDRERDMWDDALRNLQKVSGGDSQGGVLWSNVESVPFVVMQAMSDLKSWVIGMGLAATDGNGVLHISTDGKSYALSMDNVISRTFESMVIPDRIKVALRAWLESIGQ